MSHFRRGVGLFDWGLLISLDRNEIGDRKCFDSQVTSV
ncbi:hypothetical protein M595_2479 [Lyngbya aestuarii BL J]|uniref:Uncharacterized protein n=1 Tax=Lyngbya aestuarii BL J TaxID=1348334 RepID=U7QMF6_9CYAN|nr:hypothetical protein M595_2479 [Lyngbya aestuarii BL J]